MCSVRISATRGGSKVKAVLGLWWLEGIFKGDGYGKRGGRGGAGMSKGVSTSWRSGLCCGCCVELLGIASYSWGGVKSCKDRNWERLIGVKALRRGSVSLGQSWYVTIKGVHPSIEGTLKGKGEVEVEG